MAILTSTDLAAAGETPAARETHARPRVPRRQLTWTDRPSLSIVWSA